MAHADGDDMRRAIVEDNIGDLVHHLQEGHVNEEDTRGRFCAWIAALVGNFSALWRILSFTDIPDILEEIAPVIHTDLDILRNDRDQTFTIYGNPPSGSGQVYRSMHMPSLQGLWPVAALAARFESPMAIDLCINTIKGLRSYSGNPHPRPACVIIAENIKLGARRIDGIRADLQDLDPTQNLCYIDNVELSTHMNNLADLIYGDHRFEPFMKVVRRNASRQASRSRPNDIIFKAYKYEAIHNDSFDYDNVVAFCLIFKRLAQVFHLPEAVLSDHVLPYVG